MKLKKKDLFPYLYLLPALIAFVVFKYWPIIYAGALSFAKWNFVGKIKLVGFSNYAHMFSSNLFTSSFINTIKYTAILMPFYIIIPLLLAILILKIKNNFLSSLYKILIFMPTILSFAITCMVWLWMFNPGFGVINIILSKFGISKLFWLSDEYLSFWSIVIVSGWKAFGYNMIIYIAGLSAIDPCLMEAAYIDGANTWQTFWKIKWPLLSPTTLFIVINSLIYASDKAFIPINILTKGGPHEATTNLAYAIYVYGFELFNSGMANAVSIFTFIIFLIVTFMLTKFMNKRVNYES